MYRLTKFGTTSLVYYNQVDNIGSGAAPVSYMDLPDGGALDVSGAVAKAPGAVERSKKMRLQAASVAALETAFLGLLALRGRREKLYRTLASGAEHWMYARLAEVQAERDYEITQFKRIQDVELRFICQEATWHGTASGGWLLDTGESLNAGKSLDVGKVNLTGSPQAINVTISAGAGAAPVRAIAIVVTVGNAPLTSFQIARTGGETLKFTGRVPAGGQLAIYTGSMQVAATAIPDPYQYLVIAPNADLGAWFTLQPGSNTLSVTYAGGGAGAQIQLTYTEAWY